MEIPGGRIFASFGHRAVWLEDRDAPRSLVERCRSAAADEVVHAELMAALADEHGESAPACEAEPPREDLLAVALHNAVEGCVHEAFAAIVACHQAEHAQGEAMRAMFGRIAADELRHAQLAWDLHAWLLAHLDDDDRARVEAAQRRALRHLPTRMHEGARATPRRMGWPTPNHASAMAQRFAALV